MSELCQVLTLDAARPMTITPILNAKLRQVPIGTPNEQLELNLCVKRYLFVQRAAGAQFVRIAFLDE
jgi:hypothetical protein